MLKQDVVNAIASNKFHVYPIETIDEGIELLTGQSTSKRNDDGVYPEGTFNRLVSDRLAEMAERRRSFDSPSTQELTPKPSEAK